MTASARASAAFRFVSASKTPHWQTHVALSIEQAGLENVVCRTSIHRPNTVIGPAAAMQSAHRPRAVAGGHPAASNPLCRLIPRAVSSS